MNLTYTEAIEIFNGLTAILSPRKDNEGNPLPFKSDKETRTALIQNAKLLKGVPQALEEKVNETVFSITGIAGQVTIKRNDPKFEEVTKAVKQLSQSDIASEISDKIILIEEEKLNAHENNLGVEIVAISKILK